MLEDVEHPRANLTICVVVSPRDQQPCVAQAGSPLVDLAGLKPAGEVRAGLLPLTQVEAQQGSP